jgi:hypothetical protein
VREFFFKILRSRFGDPFPARFAKESVKGSANMRIQMNFFDRLTAPAMAVATLVVLNAASAGYLCAQATQRPIADFSNAQGTLVGLSTPSTCIPPQCAGRIAVIDYAGQWNQYLISKGYPSLGTTTEGSILERPLPDGRAEVTVVLHTTRALTFASTWPFPSFDSELNPRLFGYTAGEILADPLHKQPALGESHLVLTFKNTAPGAPLPDLHNWLVLGNSAPGQEIVSLYLDGNATGVLHALATVYPWAEGTPGRLIVSEIGVLNRGPFKGATADGFPVERVELRAIGQ